MEDSLSILNKTKGKLPRLPFLSMKNAVLGEKYELSVVFCGSRLSRRLNRERREKDKPTNILSFIISKDLGEIFIDLKLSYKQAKEFEREKENFIAFLFIHGLFHLKGMDHGSIMESEESKIRQQFSI